MEESTWDLGDSVSASSCFFPTEHIDWKDEIGTMISSLILVLNPRARSCQGTAGPCRQPSGYAHSLTSGPPLSLCNAQNMSLSPVQAEGWDGLVASCPAIRPCC